MSHLYILLGMALSWIVLVDTSDNYPSEAVHLIKKLNRFYRFDHNLILMESSSNIDEISSSIPTPSLVPQTLYVVSDISGEIQIRPIRRSKNTFMVIWLTSTDLQRNLNFLTKIKNYRRVNMNVKLGLFFRQTFPTSEVLMELFQWFWLMSIINIIVVYPAEVQQNVLPNHTPFVYTFNPFGMFDLIDLTGSESMDNYFPKICHNLRQHKLRIALYNDINTLIYSEGNPNFGGPDGKLWQTIFQVTNSSFTVVEFMPVNDGYHIRDLVANGTIDLGLQPFTTHVGEPSYLYPIYMDTVAIIVPSALPYSEFTTYLQTFSKDVTFVVTLLTIPVAITAMTAIRYLARKRFLILQSASDVVNLLMYDNLNIDYRQLLRAESCVILPLTLAGFVNINVLLSILTSYLTRPMDQPELNTFADIERSPFPVLVPAKKNMEQLLVRFKDKFNMDWHHKMTYTTSMDDFFHQILTFNTSICFVYIGSKVRNLLEYQKRLNIRGFRMPSQFISQTVYSYLAPVDCPLKDCFNEHIQWIMNAGLYWKWTDESYYEFVERDYFPERRQVMADERGSEKYYVPIFIVYGWIGSVLVFLIEIVWGRFELRRKKRQLYKHC